MELSYSINMELGCSIMEEEVFFFLRGSMKAVNSNTDSLRALRKIVDKKIA